MDSRCSLVSLRQAACVRKIGTGVLGFSSPEGGDTRLLRRLDETRTVVHRFDLTVIAQLLKAGAASQIVQSRMKGYRVG